MDHYWHDVIVDEFARSGFGSEQIQSDGFLDVQSLTPSLQSRWTNAATLPSRPHLETEISEAVNQEVSEFRRIFGFQPQVYVPPTFIWNDDVENALSQNGVEIIVTPGRRSLGRDLAGDLVVDESLDYWNGKQLHSGMRAIVRGHYFEPIQGHDLESKKSELITQWKLGRPVLLECHRDNFAGPRSELNKSLKAVESLLNWVVTEYPDVIFVSTEQLSNMYLRPEIKAETFSSIWAGWRYYAKRIWSISRIRKLTYFSLLIMPIFGVQILYW